MRLEGDTTHFLFGQMTNGEEEMLHLPKADLRQEVGLILYWIGRGTEEGQARRRLSYRSVVTRGYVVVGRATPLLKGSELDQLIAHHIGIGREPSLHRIHRIGDYTIPIDLVQVDDL